MKPYIKEILKKRQALPAKEYALFSGKICEKIAEMKEYRQAEHILAFYPYNKEADILPLVHSSLKQGKKVYFPKVKDDAVMEFMKINSILDFNSGYKGIMEPVKGEELQKQDMESEKCLMLLPGSVFDKNCNRCGYGKGYYDRYLATCEKKITKLGVCFSIQMVPCILDVKETDIAMDYVVNENELIKRSLK